MVTKWCSWRHSNILHATVCVLYITLCFDKYVYIYMIIYIYYMIIYKYMIIYIYMYNYIYTYDYIYTLYIWLYIWLYIIYMYDYIYIYYNTYITSIKHNNIPYLDLNSWSRCLGTYGNTRTCSEQSLRILMWNASHVHKHFNYTWQERVGNKTQESIEKIPSP